MNKVCQANGALFAIAMLMVLLCIPPDSEAASGRTYRVHGQVIAVNVTQAPYMIVVKTPLTKYDNMTVGAKVTSQTRIIRKGKRIALQALSVGEGVWLTYIKQRDGVFAQVIQVQ
jgi:drug/metabolite transporter superfamily protein YnfA